MCNRSPRVNPSRDLCPRLVPSCKPYSGLVPETSPCDWSPRVCRPLVCTYVVPAFVFKIKLLLNNLHCVNLTDLVQILFSETSFLFHFCFTFCQSKKVRNLARNHRFYCKQSTKQRIQYGAMFPEGIQGHMQNVCWIWAKTTKSDLKSHLGRLCSQACKLQSYQSC